MTSEHDELCQKLESLARAASKPKTWLVDRASPHDALVQTLDELPAHALDLAFFDEHNISIRLYATPEAVAYFLPRILQLALVPAEDPNRWRTLDWVLRGITMPGAEDYYWRGQDCRFEKRFHALSEELLDATFEVGSRTCLVRFPRWALKYMHRLRPLRAIQRQLEMVEELFHYTWPRLEDDGDRAVAELINAAFADTPYPGDRNLCGSRQGDEPAECVLELEGAKWNCVNPMLFYGMTWFTAEARRYFIPFFMICYLHHHTVYSIRDLSVKWRSAGWWNRMVSRNAVFSREERDAIISFMEHVSSEHYGARLASRHAEPLRRRAALNDFRKKSTEIGSALTHYWYPSQTDLHPEFPFGTAEE